MGLGFGAGGLGSWVYGWVWGLGLRKFQRGFSEPGLVQGFYEGLRKVFRFLRF